MVAAVLDYRNESVPGFGRAIAQAISRWFLTAETRVRRQVGQCGICFGQSDTGTVLSRVLRFYLGQYHFTAAPYSFIYNLWNGQRAR
jgi:hypothetical protein